MNEIDLDTFDPFKIAAERKAQLPPPVEDAHKLVTRIEMLHETDRLRAQIAELERRLDAALAASGRALPEFPAFIEEAFQAKRARMSGRFTATEVAREFGIPDDHGTLVKLGRFLRHMGVRTTRSKDARLFIF